ncbi:MAG: hypothetical protein NVS1B11_13150 [Terriglobales bacterium]
MLVPSLEAAGYEISRLVRGPITIAGEISWNPAHSLSPESVSGLEAVVHLAGESVVGRWTDAKKARIRESRVAGTNHLAEALAGAPKPPQVFISASAIGYYGDHGDEILREDSPSGVGFLSLVCREWEAACEPAISAGIRTANIRIGLVLSPAGGTLRAVLPVFRLGLGGKMASGRQWWSWIDIDDLVGAIHHILKGEQHGPVNLVAPNPVTNMEFTQTLAKALFRPAVLPVPKFAPRLALGREAADELMFASQRVEPTKLLSSGYVFQQSHLKDSLEKILKRSRQA